MSGKKIIDGLSDALRHAKTGGGAGVTRYGVSKSSREIVEETAREYRSALKRLAKK